MLIYIHAVPYRYTTLGFGGFSWAVSQLNVNRCGVCMCVCMCECTRVCVCGRTRAYCGIFYFLCAGSILMVVQDLHCHAVCVLVHLTTFKVHPQLIFFCVRENSKRGHWGCSKVTGNLTRQTVTLQMTALRSL